MSIYKIIVPGTKVDIEIEADSLEKNSAGAVILLNEEKEPVGVFPRETVAYNIETSPWQRKLDEVEQYIIGIQTKINDLAAELERAEERDPANEELVKQVVKDFNRYLSPILIMIQGTGGAGE